MALIRRGRDQLNSQRPSQPLPVPIQADRAQAAEYIGATARELAKQARAAGLTALGMLLEQAAMTAGTEALTARWPKDSGSS